MGTLAKKAGDSLALTQADKREVLHTALDQICTRPRKVLILPPDFTRLNSGAGELTALLYEMLSPHSQVDIMPALGTHVPMTRDEIRTMFGPEIPLGRFHVHDWRDGVVHLGDIPAEMMRDWSEAKLDMPVRVETDKLLLAGYDLILSVGQIVPHEVVGMANYTKNILVGAGGRDTINKSHFLGAVYGMERIMGRIDTPVRRLFNYGVDTFLGQLPICYVFTVMAKDADTGEVEMRGLYVGDDMATFADAARLSQKLNLDMLEKPLNKVVAYLDPHEFKSTWLGNKSVYRTRMAIADDGELVVLAPGLRTFGEDTEIDRLIRKYGYRGTPATLAAVQDNAELRDSLSAAAHLIHSSSEDRFRITYCPGPNVSAEEIRGVGYEYEPYDTAAARYDPTTLRDGYNRLANGEEIFYISNPALGLWALRSQFEAES